MTKDTRKDLQGNAAKRFLYTGPNKRRPGGPDEDEEEVVEEPRWNFSNSNSRQSYYSNGITQSSYQPHSDQGFDVDDVWNIRKNITVPKTGPPPHHDSALTRNTGKSYYSRHGGITDSEFGISGGSSDPTNTSGGTSWGQSRNYSYANQSSPRSSSLTQGQAQTSSLTQGQAQTSSISSNDAQTGLYGNASSSRHGNPTRRQGMMGTYQGMGGGHQKGHLVGGRYGLQNNHRMNNNSHDRPF